MKQKVAPSRAMTCLFPIRHFALSAAPFLAADGSLRGRQVLADALECHSK
jgi:hypothetical protein